MKALFLSQLPGTLETLWSWRARAGPLVSPALGAAALSPSLCTCVSWAAWPLHRVDPCFLLSVHSKAILFLNVSDTGERNSVGKTAMESLPGGDVLVEVAAHRSHLGAPSPPCVPGFVNDPSIKSRPPRHTGFATDRSAAALASPENRGVMRPRAGRCSARPQCPRSTIRSRGRCQALGCLWHKQTRTERPSAEARAAATTIVDRLHL